MSSLQHWWMKLTDRGFFALGLVAGGLAVGLLFIYLSSDTPKWLDNKYIEPKDTIASWLVMLFTILAFGILYLTLKVTRDVGKAQTRAYLTHTRGGLWSRHGLEWSLELKNSGNSVARDVYIIFELEYWVKVDESESEDLFLVGQDGSKRKIPGHAMTNRHIYTHPYGIGDIGAGEVVSLDNSSFAGFDNPHNDNSFSITKANVGIFAVDVFGEEISYFGGVNYAKGGRKKYDELKHIRSISAPQRTRGCVRRMSAVWHRQKERQKEVDK
jgi:hypothetical protein